MPGERRTAIVVPCFNEVGRIREEPLLQQAFLEVPLDSWRDVPGSEIRFADAIAAFSETTQLALHRRMRRNRGD
jgi:hypothetical protein